MIRTPATQVMIARSRRARLRQCAYAGRRLAIVAALAFMGPAHASEPDWQLNGFASLGVARSSFDDAAYRYQPTADAAIGTDPSPRIDTLAGLQLRYQPTDSLNFTAQLLARDPPVSGSPVVLNWAYLGWQMADRTELKLGRIQLPFFMYSDTRNVRYAQPWVRPPGELYGLVGNSEHHDGAYLRNLQALGSWSMVTELFVGYGANQNRNSSPSGTYYGIAFTGYDAHWTLRAMWLNGNTHMESPALAAVLATLQQRAPDVAADYAYETLKNAGYHTIGLRYEDERWLLLGEIAGTRTGNTRILADDVAAYLTAGCRFGAWQPYLSYAARRSAGVDADPRIVDPIAARTVGAVLAAQNYSQDTASLGLRWDLALNLALKAQFDRIMPRDGARGTFTQPLPAGRQHSDVISFAVNLIF